MEANGNGTSALNPLNLGSNEESKQPVEMQSQNQMQFAQNHI